MGVREFAADMEPWLCIHRFGKIVCRSAAGSPVPDLFGRIRNRFPIRPKCRLFGCILRDGTRPSPTGILKLMTLPPREGLWC